MKDLHSSWSAPCRKTSYAASICSIPSCNCCEAKSLSRYMHDKWYAIHTFRYRYLISVFFTINHKSKIYLCFVSLNFCCGVKEKWYPTHPKSRIHNYVISFVDHTFQAVKVALDAVREVFKALHQIFHFRLHFTDVPPSFPWFWTSPIFLHRV